MGYSKIQKIIFALLCLFIILFPFWCVRGLCSESENVDVVVVPNMSVNIPSRSISYHASTSLAYFEIEPGYVYHFKNTLNSSTKVACFSNVTPSIGLSVVPFEISAQSTLDITYSQFNYLYFDFSSGSSGFEVTREPLEGMTGAVDNLSYYVGYNIWESFTNSLAFVLPLVLVCFGMYIIAHFVNKNSKGV